MSQSTITEKRTVISSSSNVDDALADIGYKPSFGQRASNIISRSVASPMRHSGGSSIVRTVEYGYGSHMGGGFGPGGYSNVSSTGVNSVKTTREQEKKDMRDLNERFANYIEKVRFLEAQNKKLGNELDELRSKWGKETTHIKTMYEAELAEARKLIDDLSRDKAAMEIKMSSIQEQFADLNRQLEEARNHHQTDRDHINKLNQQLSDYEGEIAMLRRTIESLETERARDKATINRLQQEVDKLRIDLNNETLAHLDAENRRQTLEEEMEFMKKVHEQELKELAALAYRDTTAENREFWKSELAQAIRDIQQEYDAKVDQLRGDMEGFYNLKIQEFRTGATKQNMEVTHVREENKKLTKTISDLRGKLADLEARNAQLEKQYQELMRDFDSKDGDHMMEVTQLREEISKLRAEMEGILTELQTLMDAKLSLELEISAYRKLLEGEENRSVKNPPSRKDDSAKTTEDKKEKKEVKENPKHAANDSSKESKDESKVDWRSRASLVMYRDAFRTRQNAGQTSEIKESHVSVSRHPEQEIVQEASSDTFTASSVTTSEPGISPRGDEIEVSHTSKVTSGDGELTNTFGDKFNINADLDSQSHAREKADTTGNDAEKRIQQVESDVGSQKEEPSIKVKDEVKKIDQKIENDGVRMVSDVKTTTNGLSKSNLKTETKEDYESDVLDRKTNEVESVDKHIEASKSFRENDSIFNDKFVEEMSPEHKQSKDLIKQKVSDETSSKDGHIEVEMVSMKEEASFTPESSPKADVVESRYGLEESHQVVIEKDDLSAEKVSRPPESLQFEKDITSKDHNLGTQIEKKVSPEKSLADTDMENTARLSTKQSDEQIIPEKYAVEKTEDKVLESEVQTEVTEESFKNKIGTATVELSPTKEKPHDTKESHKKTDDTTVSGKTEIDADTDFEASLSTENKSGLQVTGSRADDFEKQTPSTTTEAGNASSENSRETKSDVKFNSSSVVSDETAFKKETQSEMQPTEITEESTSKLLQEIKATDTEQAESDSLLAHSSINKDSSAEEVKQEFSFSEEKQSDLQPTKVLEGPISDLEKEDMNIKSEIKASFSDISPQNETESVSSALLKDQPPIIEEHKSEVQLTETSKSDFGDTLEKTHTDSKGSEKPISRSDSLEIKEENDKRIIPVKDAESLGEKIQAELQSTEKSQEASTIGVIQTEIQQTSSESLQSERSLSSENKTDSESFIDVQSESSISSAIKTGSEPSTETKEEQSESRAPSQIKTNEDSVRSPKDDTLVPPSPEIDQTSEREDSAGLVKNVQEIKNDMVSMTELTQATSDKREEIADQQMGISRSSLEKSDSSTVNLIQDSQSPGQTDGMSNSKQIAEIDVTDNQNVTCDSKKADDKSNIESSNTLKFETHETEKQNESVRVIMPQMAEATSDKDRLKVESEHDASKSSIATDKIEMHDIDTSEDVKETADTSVIRETESMSEGTPIKVSDQALYPKIIEKDSDRRIITDNTLKETESVTAYESEHKDDLSEAQKLNNRAVLDHTTEDAFAGSTEFGSSLEAETSLSSKQEDESLDLDEKNTTSGDIINDKDEPLTSDAKVAQPLINGEIESPTEESPDVVPGSAEEDDSQVSMKMMRGEVSAKTTYQRTSTGPIAISEVDTEGKFITLENTSSGPNRRDVNLDGWRLKRTVDGKRDYIYPFRNFTLKSGKSVKILARKAAGQAGLNDLVYRDEDSWGVGSQVTTALINDKDEEKATHVQKTLYN